MIVSIHTSIVTNIKHPLLFSIVASILVSVIFSILVILSLDPNILLFAYGDSSIPVISSNNYLEQVKANYSNQNNSLWSLGNGIAEGDYFQYKICNDDTMYQITYPYHCYTIDLEFVRILESYTGDTWIVQSYVTIGDTIGDGTINNSTSPLILLIDPNTFDVSTDPFNKKIGVSLENTIFSLSQYGGTVGTSLSIGTIWDYLDSYFTNDIPLEIKNKQSIQIFNTSINGTIVTRIVTNIETSVLSYDMIIPSNIYLHNDFPFPLKAKLYSPNIIYPEPQELYYYELLDYSTSDTKRNIQGELR